MRWYKEKPDEGDFVVVTITDVDKNSAYAEMDEYPGLQGLIHISEVSRSWIQDVRKELGEGEKDVAQVIDADDDGSLDLSLKRVNDKQKKETMARWKKEQKADKFVEELADRLGEDVEDLYEEVVFPMQKEFGSSFTGFEIAVGEEERLEEMFDEETVAAIKEVSRENINLRQEKLEGEVEVQFSSGDGVEKVKELFGDMEEGIEVKYVSAPTYAITAWGRNSQLAKKRMDEAVERLREKTEDLGGRFEFSRA
ncbi:MAG: S1 RNA-binding domain-containing protein [Candidatus Nanohaloarchaea archaeon]